MDAAAGQAIDVARLVAQHTEPASPRSGTCLIFDGIEAFALRVASARSAQHTLDVQYYIWHDDMTGRYLANELLVAADRGIRVRMLIDDMDARPRNAVFAALDLHENIEIRLFNPFRTRSGVLRTAMEFFKRGSRLNHRMHNKAWIADGRVAIVGGRNIGDEYFAASAEVNFIDTDVALTGAAADATASEFARYWNSRVSVPIARLHRTARNRTPFAELRTKLRESAIQVAHSEYAEQVLGAQGVLDSMLDQSKSILATDVHVIADDPSKATARAPARPGVLESLIEVIGETRSELLLVSPYFVPGAGGTGALRELVRKGVRVAVLTNSLAATDVAAVHSGYSRYRTALLECGVELRELKPTFKAKGKARIRLGSSRASLHTKALVADGERSFVGSFNLDPRSAVLNCEMGVWIRHPMLAQQLTVAFEESASLDNSFAVTLDARGRPVWTERIEGRLVQHFQDPYASWLRRAITWLLGLLPIEPLL